MSASALGMLEPLTVRRYPWMGLIREWLGDEHRIDRQRKLLQLGWERKYSMPERCRPALGLLQSGVLRAGMAALFSTRNYFQYGGQTGVSSASILTDQFSNGATTRQTFDALVSCI